MKSDLYVEQFFADYWWIFVLIALWTLPWKGLALWKAARQNSKNWFIALFLLNTLAILEILYIFKFSRNSNK